MAGKLFYRERMLYTEGSDMPRYMLVAVQGVELTVYGRHLRMSELKALADATGAELVALPRAERGADKRLQEIKTKAS